MRSCPKTTLRLPCTNRTRPLWRPLPSISLFYFFDVLCFVLHYIPQLSGNYYYTRDAKREVKPIVSFAFLH